MSTEFENDSEAEFNDEAEFEDESEDESEAEFNEEIEYNSKVTLDEKTQLMTSGQMNLKSLINQTAVILQEDEQKIVYRVTHNKKPIIIKAIISGSKDYTMDEAVNEAFIGFYGINILNSPNFSRILGYEFDSKCVRRLKAEACDYIAYEYITGPTLLNYIIEGQNSRDDLIFIIRQVFRALFKAYKKINFVHYDLHLKNIIISPIYGPVIIDYGRSHIRYQDKDYGMEGREAGAFNSGYWEFDIIYLLMNLISNLCNADSIVKSDSIEADSINQMAAQKRDKLIVNLNAKVETLNQDIAEHRPLSPNIDYLKLDVIELKLSEKLTSSQFISIQDIDSETGKYTFFEDNYGNMSCLIDLLLTQINSNYYNQYIVEQLLSRDVDKINSDIFFEDNSINGTIDGFDKFIKLMDKLMK